VPTLPPILEAAKSAAMLRVLEKAGTGDEAQSKALAGDVTTRAITLFTNALNDMTRTTQAISASANTVFTLPMQRVNPITHVRFFDQTPYRQGLINNDAARLKTILQTCVQISTACADLNLLLDAPDAFNGAAKDANTLAQKAGIVLNDDYSRMP
jgi:hypothetical protein